MVKIPQEGDKAPGFSVETDTGGTVSLKDFAGKPLIVYFYPKDDTAGCTREAIEFSAEAEAFQKLGVAVLGVSPDGVAAHGKFRKKHALTVMLGADPERAMIEAFGVWVEKSMYGRTYMGVERSTFLIDGEGVVRRVWRKVRVPGHVAQALEAAKELA